MIDAIMLNILGLPLEWLNDLSFERIREFSEKVEDMPLQRLFLKSYYNSMKRYRRVCMDLVPGLERAVINDEGKFLALFSRGESSYEQLVAKLLAPGFNQELSGEIVRVFGLEGNYCNDLVSIVNDSMVGYRSEYLREMTGQKGVQLLILLQGMNLPRVLESLTQLVGSSAAGAFRLVVEKEGEDGKNTTVIRKRKQVKILALTASPGENSDGYYELAQDMLLDGFTGFNREVLYLDLPDPVKGTLSVIKEYMGNGKHDVVYLDCLGGVNEQGEGFLYLENDGGGVARVTGKELVEVMQPLPKLIILLTCRQGQEGVAMVSVGRYLVEAGVAGVIVMNKRLSREAALDFNWVFFQCLVGKQTVGQAFETAIAAMLPGEKAREGEAGVPVLLGNGELGLNDFSDHLIVTPGGPECHRFKNMRSLDRSYTGRRGLQREILKKVIVEKKGAVVIVGSPGVGKSALLTRITYYLKQHGYEMVVIRGDTRVENILLRLSQEATELGISETEAIYTAQVPVEDKLAWFMGHLLVKNKIAIIFDNFEENLLPGGKGEFRRKRLQEFLLLCREWLVGKESLLLFSCRTMLPGFEVESSQFLVDDFSPAEYHKMVWKSLALNRMDRDSVHELQEQVHGNPLVLELLDKIAFQEFPTGEFTWEGLKGLFAGMKTYNKGDVIATDKLIPMLLERALRYLSQEQRRLLDIVSIFRWPVPDSLVEDQDIIVKPEDRARLFGFSLLQCFREMNTCYHYVHRYLAGYLHERMSDELRERYHFCIADYYWKKNEESNTLELDDAIEARWHYVQAGKWERAARLTFSLDNYLCRRGYYQCALDVLQELEVEKLSTKNQWQFHNRLGKLYLDFGDFGQALFHYHQAMEINERSEDFKGVATILYQIGMIYQVQGDYDTALDYHLKSEELFAGLDAQKDLSLVCHQIGVIYQLQDNFATALKYYQKSLQIIEKRGNSTEVAEGMMEMGLIYLKIEDYETALNYFIPAFRIFKSLGEPYQKLVLNYVNTVREKITASQFQGILAQFNLGLEELSNG